MHCSPFGKRKDNEATNFLNYIAQKTEEHERNMSESCEKGKEELMKAFLIIWYL